MDRRIATENHHRVPVLVCGGGPVGLALAVELGLRGIPCLVVEPREQPTRLRPRGKTLNTRTLEHFRRWGIADRVRAAAPLPPSWSQDVSFCTTLLGTEITRFHGVLGLQDTGVSPELGQQLPQYVTEEVLREVALELAPVELRLGWRVTGLRPEADSVSVSVVDRDGNTQDVVADYVVGADGARSVVRESIGAAYVGQQALRPNTGVVFRCDDLASLVPRPPAVQTWVINDETPGMLGPVDRNGLWWLIAFGVDGTSPDLDPRRLVAGAVGRDLPVDIVSTDPWVARMELADRCRAGRVFLAGDAAHLNPPFGGHGLNTGIGDSVDLGWKLAATIDGWAGPAVLDSYRAERVPLHRRVIDEAVANMSTLSTELLGDDLTDPGPRGEESRARAAARIQDTKAQEFFSLDLVLGHRYEDSPIIPAATTGQAGPWRSAAVPGRRLPHLWLEPDRSTLDLVRLDHVVIAGPRHHGRPTARGSGPSAHARRRASGRHRRDGRAGSRLDRRPPGPRRGRRRERRPARSGPGRHASPGTPPPPHPLEADEELACQHSFSVRPATSDRTWSPSSSAAGERPRVLVRDGDRARGLFGDTADVVSGDVTAPGVVEDAAEGMDSIFLLSPHSFGMADLQLGVIRALRRRDIRIVKLSGTSSAITPDGPHACRQHWEVEQVLVHSGQPYVILRPNSFMQVLIGRLMLPALQATGA